MESLLALHGDVVLGEKLVNVHDEEVLLVELLEGDGLLPELGPQVGRLRVRGPLHLHLRLRHPHLVIGNHKENSFGYGPWVCSIRTHNGNLMQTRAVDLHSILADVDPDPAVSLNGDPNPATF